jgi:hypothetical protein
MFNSLRLALATTALVLSLGGSALAAAAPPAGPVDLETPDCLTSCTKTLAPGQRLIVAAPGFAYKSVTVNGSASNFGARFVLKNAPDGVTFKKVVETSLSPSFSRLFTSVSAPTLFPSAFKAIAVNDGTLFNTTVTLSVVAA